MREERSGARRLYAGGARRRAHRPPLRAPPRSFSALLAARDLGCLGRGRLANRLEHVGGSERVAPCVACRGAWPRRCACCRPRGLWRSCAAARRAPWHACVRARPRRGRAPRGHRCGAPCGARAPRAAAARERECVGYAAACALQVFACVARVERDAAQVDAAARAARRDCAGKRPGASPVGAQPARCGADGGRDGSAGAHQGPVVGMWRGC